jgi:lysophospholipase L1-like esterase
MQAMIDTLLSQKSQQTRKSPKIFLCSPIKAFRDKWGITDSVIVNEVIPAIQRVAAKNNLPFIDLHPVVSDPHDMTSDMIHPNDKGAAKMAEAVAKCITEGK